MSDESRLTIGERHRWRVRQREPFGLVVAAADLPGERIGILDLVFMPPDVRGQGHDDFPPIGTIVEAVVQGYTSSGQLRLSMLAKDMEA